jgi:hypothetical protein
VTARAAEVAIRELPVSQLATYAAVPIAIRVTSRLIQTGRATGAETLTEVPVARPFDKDYDAVAGMPPLAWPSRYAVERWGLLVASMEDRVVGGAAVAPAAEVMPSQDVAGSTAVLWDRLESYEPDAYDAMPGEARLIWRAPMTDE